MRKKKVKRKTRPIVIGHLERISSKVFDRYRKQIADMIKGNYGVYALYRRDKLYYIGMATDFRRRLNKHLRDRLKGKWNQFSLYLIRKTDHLREVESLLLRITRPVGNKITGKLKQSVNLRPKLKRIMTADSKKVIEEILGTAKPPTKKHRAKGKAAKEGNALKGLLRNGQGLYANYKGKSYRAIFYTQRGIKLGGKFYLSPTGAAKAIVDRRTVNGWNFWKYKDESGNLTAIKHLRK